MSKTAIRDIRGLGELPRPIAFDDIMLLQLRERVNDNPERRQHFEVAFSEVAANVYSYMQVYGLLPATSAPPAVVGQTTLIDLTGQIPGPGYTFSPQLVSTNTAMVFAEGLGVSTADYAITVAGMNYAGFTGLSRLEVLAAVNYSTPTLWRDTFGGPGGSFALSKTTRSGETWPLRNGLLMAPADFNVVANAVEPVAALLAWEILDVLYNYDS